MDSLASKLSLYDILAMIIPGWLLLSFFLTIFVIDDYPIFNICLTDHTCFIYLVYITGDIYLKIFVTLILSYIIGLIWNMFMNVIFAGFRNDYFSIKRSWISMYIFNNNYYHNKNIINNFIEAHRVLLLIYNYLFTHKISYYNPLLRYIIIDLYYSSYYHALKNKFSNDIPILEGQVVFLRNIIIIFILYIIIPFTFYNINLIKCCMLAFILFILAFLSFFAMISRQNKIYQRVWEDDYYLRKIGY